LILRLDDAAGSWPEDAVAQLAAAVPESLADAAAVVVCDYASGLLTGAVRDAVAQHGTGILTVVDAHDPRPWHVLRPDLVTPNAGEVARVLGLTFAAGADRAAVVADHAAEVLEATGAAAAVVTLDRDGTILLGADGVHRTWAQPQTEKQASGAGDTFVAALTLGRAAGLPLTTSADLGQAAADVVVRHPGTSVCTTADLARHLGSFADTALDQDELIRRVAGERAAGRRIVLTNGCFDVLSRGHTRYLNQAKQLGDVLVVAVNSDASARRLKGPGHPRNSVTDRAAVLAALSCVDYVTAFDTDTVVPLIEALRPDVYAKGGDYTPQMLEETPVVLAAGGRVRILDYVPEPL
ncbi:PfkB family carbohydrate kinase, partial [uncultured Aeromicrobium sp.]|uniref:PfkB family carbohydrate kinase n=1 Tax=uncultured Aeromicrobium sp. TaxID=337820 RepID=UPI0025D779CC